MTEPIGELRLQGGSPLLKMWSVDVPPGPRIFFKHSHTRFEINVVIDGEGVYTTERAVYPMRKGDVFVFASNELHCITDVSKQGLSIINLSFEPRYLMETSAGGFGERYMSFCFSHADDFENRIPAESAVFLRENCQKLKEELVNQEKSYPIAITSYLTLILLDLLRNHGYQMPATKETSKDYSYMLQLYDYIEKHLCENLDLHTLAGVAGLSPNYLSHIFKQLNGISLWDYILAKRVEKATRLLRDTDHTPTMLEIALQCGFNNTVNFNKAFKKQKGFPPSHFRKNPQLLSP